MVGDIISIRDVLHVLEARSAAPYNVSVVTKKQLEDRAASVQGLGSNIDEVVMKLTAQMELVMMEEKVAMALLEPILNELCPSVRPYSVKKFVDAIYNKNDQRSRS